MFVNSIYKDSSASRYLDLLRFIAAFTVVMHHTVVVIPFESWSLKHPNSLMYWPLHFLYEWCLTGYQFVMVFFVLSGYFIGSSVLKLIRDGKWSWKVYLTNRLTRLWVVLIPALLLTVIWNHVTLSRYPNAAFVGNDFLSWKVFLGNLFFLQGIKVPLFGHNGPLWSLDYEFWYYILFPCIVLIFSSRRWWQRILYLVVAVGISVFVGPAFLAYFVIWLVGAAVSVIKPLQLNRRWARVTIVAIAGYVSARSLQFLYVHNNLNPGIYTKLYVPDLSVGFTFGLFVYFVLSFFNTSKAKRKRNVFGELAGFSYTLYLVHYPVLDYINMWSHSKGWPLKYRDYLHIGVFVIAAVLVYSWIISKLTEAHTDKVRRFMLKVMNLRRTDMVVKQKTADTSKGTN